MTSDMESSLFPPDTGGGVVWQNCTSKLVLFNAAMKRHLIVYNGLGLYCLLPQIEIGAFKSTPVWGLYHLNTGHLIVSIRGEEQTAKNIGAEIAGLGDWTFDGLEGWRNVFPEVKERLTELIARFPGIIERKKDASSNEQLAQEVLDWRETENINASRRSVLRGQKAPPSHQEVKK